MEGGRARQAVEAFAETARSPNLRRVQLAFGAAFAAEWGLTVAIGILAYRDGGVAAVGAVALARLLPSALLAPLVSGVIDRHRRDHVLVAACAIRAVALGLAGVVLAATGEPIPVYVLAAVATVAHTFVRPASSALLPSLCTTPSQLTSANVVRGLLDSLSALVGPLAVGLLVGPIGIDGVLVVAGVAVGWGGWLVSRVRYEVPPRAEAVVRGSTMHEVLAGFAIMLERREVGLMTGLAGMQAFTRGAFSVFAVVMAIDMLDIGEAGVGVLTAAFGAGAVVGSFGASLLVGASGFARWLGVGVALWSAPFAVVAFVSQEWAAFALLMIVGVGNALVDVAGFTAFNHLVPDEVMGRFFAGFEAVVALGVALGGPGAALLIELLGQRGAFIAVGALGPVCVLASWPALRRADIRMGVATRVIAVLQRVPMLRPLPLATIARLATLVNGREVPPGAVVVQEGETADDFFVIAHGRADVTKADRHLRRLGPGDCFGEIAALTRGPRTSTVRADTELKLLRLRGEHFVNVVSGYTPSESAAGALVAERLARG